MMKIRGARPSRREPGAMMLAGPDSGRNVTNGSIDDFTVSDPPCNACHASVSQMSFFCLFAPEGSLPIAIRALHHSSQVRQFGDKKRTRG